MFLKSCRWVRHYISLNRQLTETWIDCSGWTIPSAFQVNIWTYCEDGKPRQETRLPLDRLIFDHFLSVLCPCYARYESCVMRHTMQLTFLRPELPKSDILFTLSYHFTRSGKRCVNINQDPNKVYDSEIQALNKSIIIQLATIRPWKLVCQVLSAKQDERSIKSTNTR